MPRATWSASSRRRISSIARSQVRWREAGQATDRWTGSRTQPRDGSARRDLANRNPPHDAGRARQLPVVEWASARATSRPVAPQRHPGGLRACPRRAARPRSRLQAPRPASASAHAPIRSGAWLQLVSECGPARVAVVAADLPPSCPARGPPAAMCSAGASPSRGPPTAQSLHRHLPVPAESSSRFPSTPFSLPIARATP